MEFFSYFAPHSLGIFVCVLFGNLSIIRPKIFRRLPTKLSYMWSEFWPAQETWVRGEHSFFRG